MRLHGRLEPGAEPAEQRVSGQMAERVVVALEPVEVEDDQDEGRAIRVGAGTLEVGQQLAAVAEPGERIRNGQLTALGQDQRVLAEGQGGADEDGEDGCGREADHERALRLEVVVDEEREAHQAGDRRGREQRTAGEVDVGRTAGRLPGGERDQERGRRPEGVHHHPFDVGADRGLVQVDGVGHGRRHQPGADRDPGAVRPPAKQREDCDDEREENDVRERIGEGRGDDRQASSGGLEHEADEQGRPDRRRRKRRGDAVEPDAHVRPGDPRPHEQEQRDVCERVEAEVEHVRDRRERGLLSVAERVDQVAGRP